MEKLKAALDKIFIEGLSAMAQGLFATLIIGTIIQQAGTLMGGTMGDMLFAVGKVAASLTGAGIGLKKARLSLSRQRWQAWSARLRASSLREQSFLREQSCMPGQESL